LSIGRPDADDAGGRSGIEPAARALGVILAGLGGALLAMELYPTAEWPQAIVAVVAALAATTVWAVSLYIGTLVMLMTLPVLLGLGAGLLAWAAFRFRSGDPWRWPAAVGVVLIALGVSCLLDPPVGGPYVPIVLLAMGALLVSARQRSRVAPAA
jgi:uncharacterized membrane protein HdeD (DUF308 family)